MDEADGWNQDDAADLSRALNDGVTRTTKALVLLCSGLGRGRHDVLTRPRHQQAGMTSPLGGMPKPRADDRFAINCWCRKE